MVFYSERDELNGELELEGPHHLRGDDGVEASAGSGGAV
jgi:hypothetical protein